MPQAVPEGTNLWISGFVTVHKYIKSIDCYHTSAGPAARWLIEGVYNRNPLGNLRSVGIDISKKEYSAIALAIGGEPQKVKAWRNPIPQDSEAAQLLAWDRWLTFQLRVIYKPDIVAVEELAVFMNKNTIRTLARREGVALLVARKTGAIVLNPSVGSARNVALGIPANSPKEAAWLAMKAKYPSFKFAASNQGGQDQADALTHALAAPTLLERR